MSYVRFGLSALLMLAAVAMLAISVLGIYRFRFALNRLHAAAMTDTLALMLAMASLLVAMGLRLATMKLIAVRPSRGMKTETAAMARTALRGDPSALRRPYQGERMPSSASAPRRRLAAKVLPTRPVKMAPNMVTSMGAA